MKVFISWSGETSHKVAKVFRDWLPSVIQSIVPYVSSEDIDKGARWSTDIAGELDESSFGIICVTKDNLSAPWVNFEAGALSKSINKSNVCPFLFNIKRSEVEGPILQFQSTIYEKEDVFKLIKTMNTACVDESIDDSRLDKSFDVWWPILEEGLDSLGDELQDQGRQQGAKLSVPDSRSEKILEEILELTRLNQKLLRNPSEILPAEYLSKVLSAGFHPSNLPPDLINTIESIGFTYAKLTKTIMTQIDSCNNAQCKKEISDQLYYFFKTIRHLKNILRGRDPNNLCPRLELSDKLEQEWYRTLPETPNSEFLGPF
jgi:hypothetical protein